MGITGAIGFAKAVAGFIEKKFPGTCPDLVSELDHATQSSAFFRLKMKELQDKWNEIKDGISDSDKNELTNYINTEGFGVDGQVVWSDSGFVDAVDLDGVFDVATAVDGVTDGGILDAVGDFLADLFS